MMANNTIGQIIVPLPGEHPGQQPGQQPEQQPAAVTVEEYDPYKNRNVKHPTSNFDTLIHLLKGSLGTGILAMPNAFLNSGYIIGIIGTIILASICTLGIHLVIKSEYELCKRKKVASMSYPAVAEAAFLDIGQRRKSNILKGFAPIFGQIVNVVIFIFQMGTCCIYVVFISTNIKSITDFYTDEPTDVRIFMAIILLPLVLMNWVRNLKYLAPFSTIANILTLVSFGMIWYFIFREPVSFDDRDPVGELVNFPLYFGTVLFALEAIGVILPLQNQMKTPQSFGGPFGVLNRGMIIIALLYVLMGLFGYLKFGNLILGSITLNLPADEILAQCVKGLLSVAIYVSHGVQCYVAIEISWNNGLAKFAGNGKMKLFWEFVTRTIIVLVTVALAVAIPNLELFISLIGAFCLSTLGLAFPAIIYLLTFSHQLSGPQKILVPIVNAILILIGFAGFIIGTYTSVDEIIQELFIVNE